MSERKSSGPIQGNLNYRRDTESEQFIIASSLWEDLWLNCPKMAYLERAQRLVTDFFVELRVRRLLSTACPRFWHLNLTSWHLLNWGCSGENIILVYSHNLLRLCESNLQTACQQGSREAAQAFLGLHRLQNWSPGESKPRQIQQLWCAVHVIRSRCFILLLPCNRSPHLPENTHCLSQRIFLQCPDLLPSPHITRFKNE